MKDASVLFIASKRKSYWKPNIHYWIRRHVIFLVLIVHAYLEEGFREFDHFVVHPIENRLPFGIFERDGNLILFIEFEEYWNDLEFVVHDCVLICAVATNVKSQFHFCGTSYRMRDAEVDSLTGEKPGRETGALKLLRSCYCFENIQ